MYYILYIFVYIYISVCIPVPIASQTRQALLFIVHSLVNHVVVWIQNWIKVLASVSSFLRNSRRAAFQQWMQCTGVVRSADVEQFLYLSFCCHSTSSVSSSSPSIEPRIAWQQPLRLASEDISSLGIVRHAMGRQSQRLGQSIKGSLV